MTWMKCFHVSQILSQGADRCISFAGLGPFDTRPTPLHDSAQAGQLVASVREASAHMTLQTLPVTYTQSLTAGVNAHCSGLALGGVEYCSSFSVWHCHMKSSKAVPLKMLEERPQFIVSLMAGQCALLQLQGGSCRGSGQVLATLAALAQQTVADVTSQSWMWSWPSVKRRACSTCGLPTTCYNLI